MSDPVQTLRRCPVHSLTGVQIIGTGSYLPDKVVTNKDLSALGHDADWIRQRTGIEERRHAEADVSTSDLAVAASQASLEAAEVAPEEVDLVVLGTMSPDYLLPQTASAVQDRLGLNCPAMDVSGACASFMYALVTASQYVANGCSRRALVIGADTNSRLMNPTDIKTYPIFGDGAGAVVLAPGNDQQGLLAYTLGVDGAGSELICRPMGGVRTPFSRNGVEGSWYFQMEGRPVFKWAVRLLGDTFAQVLKHAGRSHQDISLWLLHQANSRILDAATENCGIDRNRVVMHLDRYGNTSAGSIPIALDESLRKGEIQPGDELMMCGFGAGLSWGTALWRW